MRPESYSFICYFAEVGQGKDLITAGISHKGSFPANETVKAAGLFYGIKSGSLAEMISIAKDYGNAGVKVLTTARVATGIKAGVSMRPCAVSSMPARAEVLASRASRQKLNEVPFFSFTFWLILH
jgi:hypothetical protein